MRMSYETYAYLRTLVEDQMVKLENDYRIALTFIPLEGVKLRGKTGTDKATEIFRKEYTKLRAITEELYAAAATTYKDHPDKEMRKFWGLTE